MIPRHRVRTCAFCGEIHDKDNMIEKKGKFYCDIFCWRNWSVPRKSIVVLFPCKK